MVIAKSLPTSSWEICPILGSLHSELDMHGELSKGPSNQFPTGPRLMTHARHSTKLGKQSRRSTVDNATMRKLLNHWA